LGISRNSQEKKGDDRGERSAGRGEAGEKREKRGGRVCGKKKTS